MPGPFRAGRQGSQHLLHLNRPQQLRLEEPARNRRQDNRRETDHSGIDQQAPIADYAGLEKPVADEQQCMGDGSANK